MESESKELTIGEKMNILVAIIQIIPHMPELFVRRFGTFGERYVGFQFVLSWLFLFFLCGFFPNEDPRPLLTFWLLCTVMLLIHRIAGVCRRSLGYVCHSLSVGRSWFWGSFLFQAFTESVVMFGAAVLLADFGPLLSNYLVVSAICHYLSHLYIVQADAARVRAARDARIDAEWMARQMEN